MDAVDGGHTRDDRFPIVFFLVEGLPQSALLHLELGEFAAMVDLNGFVGISVKRLLKGAACFEIPTVRPITANEIPRNRSATICSSRLAISTFACLLRWSPPPRFVD
jgi:hypothetical protein